ncbi:hypothetical protein FISHEDRAFT_27185, partial [Fistulina hepatica ATCC 64428]
QQQQFDFFSYQSPSDSFAPHPDVFELELDSSLAAVNDCQLQLLTVDNDAFNILRAETPVCGPPSAITVSSESGYDSRSESCYSYSHSPSYRSCSNYTFPLDLDVGFHHMTVDSVSDYGAAPSDHSRVSSIDNTLDPAAAFGGINPSRSPPSVAKSYAHSRSTYSDYSPAQHSTSSDYYNSLCYNGNVAHGSTISPNNISQLPMVPNISVVHSQDDMNADPRKKYKCTICPRAFARAYNLKTHMATHDPNRPKPHVCPYRSCGRSFSRKHDLGRHLVSIHREDASMHSSSKKTSVGVERGSRNWCDRCGKGCVGREAPCECADVK